MDDQKHPAQRVKDRTLTVSQEIGPWRVEYRWPIDADQGGPWSIVINPGPRATAEDVAGGLSSTITRQLDFLRAAEGWRETRDEMHRTLRGRRRTYEEVRAGMVESLSSALRAALADGITDVYLSTLSQGYVALVRIGERSVTATLAEAAGKAAETIRAHLKEARKRDLLTTVRGRAGGQLTEKADGILAGLSRG